jgi:predicted small secreted protein
LDRGRMGAIAKNAIGIIATAAAAIIVRILIEKAKVESLHRTKTAKDPTRRRRPIAESSTIMNGEFWSDVAARLSSCFGVT